MPGWAAITTGISIITIASTGIIAETDPREWLIHIARPLPADIRPGPHAIASPVAGGPVRFAGKSGRLAITEMRIPFGSRKV